MPCTFFNIPIYPELLTSWQQGVHKLEFLNTNFLPSPLYPTWSLQLVTACWWRLWRQLRGSVKFSLVYLVGYTAHEMTSYTLTCWLWGTVRVSPPWCQSPGFRAGSNICQSQMFGRHVHVYWHTHIHAHKHTYTHTHTHTHTSRVVCYHLKCTTNTCDSCYQSITANIYDVLRTFSPLFTCPQPVLSYLSPSKTGFTHLKGILRKDLPRPTWLFLCSFATLDHWRPLYQLAMYMLKFKDSYLEFFIF